MQSTIHVYEVRPRKDKRGVDLISDALPSRRLWYGEPKAVANAIGYAQFYSRSHHTVIRVYDELVDTLTRFLPNSASLGRSSIRRRTFPARSLRLFLTRHRRIQHGGERKRPMNPFIQLKTVTPVFVVTLVCVGLLPTMRAVSPAQEEGYAGGNTAEGQNALPSLNGGI